MGKWIFQDIVDIKNNVLYANMKRGKTLKESMELYKLELRQKISPELYVRFIISAFDIHLDVTMTRVSAQNVYPELTEKQVYEWVEQYKQPHHFLTW